MTVPVSRLFAAMLIALGVALSMMGLDARFPVEGMNLAAATAGPNLGTLQVTPGTGLATTRSTVTTISSGAAKGCPATTSYVRANATGPGGWAGGLLVLGTTDQDFSTTNEFSVALSDTWAGIAASNSTSIVAGTYNVTLTCLDATTTVSQGAFGGSVTFANATSYTTGAVATPTATATATPTATATATGTATATATASATATATTTASATSTPTATGSASPTPTASSTATPEPTPTDTPTAEPTEEPTEDPGTSDVVVYDGSGATLGDTPALHPGAQVRVVAPGYEPDEDVTATVFSTPQLLGHVNASASGIVSYLFQVPANLPVGAHSLVLAGQSQSVTVAFTVTTAAAPTAAAGGALPRTGFGTGPTLALGFGLIGTGIVMTRSGRRTPRRQPKHLLAR